MQADPLAPLPSPAAPLAAASPTQAVRADDRAGAPGPTRIGAGLTRRDFLRAGGLTVAGLALTRGPAVAGPFTRADFHRLVPEDKKLSPEWIRSLFERGTRTVYRGADLELIGMPVGGLCCGQVYLGGDGRLWHWDIFNQHIGTGAEHYAKPLKPTAPFEQGFALRTTVRGQTAVRPLTRAGWSDITFNGEYPLAFLTYRDPGSPVTVSLEAFSPFIPLNVEDSSLPVTVMRFTLENRGTDPVEADLTGWFENPVGLHRGAVQPVQRRNRAVHRPGLVALECSAEPPPLDAAAPPRPDILFDDFERATYAPWQAEGTAFGSGPVERSQVPEYQGNLGMQGERAVNSHASAPGSDVGARDAQTGTLLSPAFTIERNYVTFLIGGGSHRDKTCVNLLIDGQVVLSATGANDNRMRPHSWDVRKWAGRTARLQVVDQVAGGWGNIGLDHIVFSDQPRRPLGELADAPDFGTLTLALLEAAAEGRPAAAPAVGAGPAASSDVIRAALGDRALPAAAFPSAPADVTATVTRPFGEPLIGSVSRRVTLAPGAAEVVTFLITWHFPNLRMDRLPPGRYYGTRFPTALAVAEYVARHLGTLREQTHRWHDTWYDSTLPYWFLDRTFLNTSILATSTSFRFANGRFWGWEGVGCCHGTCGHVWQYAQAVARLFPELERDTRERVDFGLAQQPDGAIFFRAEFNNIPAVDGQAGTVLRALREHQMTTDNTWLERNWPGIRRAVAWLIAQDGNGDGLLEGAQHNTLDTDWYGPVAWLSGLYLAALRAGETMARLVGDGSFADQCRAIFDRGQARLVKDLFDGEYFINRPDPARPDTINSGTGCHIDQVLGQSWAWQVGLGRILPAAETISALKALWRYNFTPDVGPYRAVYTAGRWYAMPGEGGLLMCSFPREGWDYAQAKGKGADWAAGYFNECMNGFEYQAAWHMIAEGLVQEGLAVTRMVHDRYHPSRRNPWNEVECGDHYARSMASYGVFLAACGYGYDGPQGRLAFAPRLTPEDFRCAFTTATGWGTFAQRLAAGRASATLTLRWGHLRLRRLVLGSWPGNAPAEIRVTLEGQPVAVTARQDHAGLELQFEAALTIGTGATLLVERVLGLAAQ